ncbi:MAG: S8 family serine peptidase [Deltaproteobacteria bacterium]|nr:S8 family serine peptidase [Deltaproteobacteria bacterium]
MSINIASFLSAQAKKIADQSNMQSAEEPSTLSIPEKLNRKLGPRLKYLIEQNAALQKSGKRIPQADTQNKIKLMLQIKEGSRFNRTGIIAQNGSILSRRKNLVAAELPLDRIEAIVDADPHIEFVRLPHKFFPLDKVSQGVNLTGAYSFHSSNYKGKGVKIAVIDIGFKGLTEAQASGDLPQNIFPRNFTGQGFETLYKHGTGCAEIVYDMAPEAELHLLRVDDEEAFYQAFDYCCSNKIKIVSLSIGAIGSGPGNGTGPLDEICDEARENGILIVGSAGNSANTKSSDGVPVGSHWEGAFTDANFDNIHEFSGQNGNIIIALAAWDDDGNPKHNEVTIVMRWNDWQTVTSDYDMYLYYYDYTSKTIGNLIASSALFQNGPPLHPYEEIVVDLPNELQHQFYYLQVTKKTGSLAGKKLEIHLGKNCYFIGREAYSQPIATSSSSITEPADAASVFTVGAINYSNWSYGPQEDFSSQGPTNDWAGTPSRIKPDICGPDAVTTQTYGQKFLGTSAATPHVAGAAALILGEHPNMLPDDIQSFLEESAADLGISGKDNIYGAGKLRLNVNQSNKPPIIEPLHNKTIYQGVLLTFSISASDPEKDDLTYTSPYLRHGATFDPTTRTFSWRPSYNQQGSYYFYFRAYDATGPSYGSENLTITVLQAPPRSDLDNNYKVDLSDAIMAMQILSKSPSLPALRADYAESGADVNSDSSVGTEELIYIFQILANLR